MMSKIFFQGRAFVSMLMAMGFTIVALSGLVLYVAPHGRGWGASGWTFLSLNRHAWAQIHIVFGILFIPLACVHLWLNRKPFLSYLRNRLAESSLHGVRVRFEYLAALCVCAFLVVSVLYDFPPGSTLLGLFH